MILLKVDCYTISKNTLRFCKKGIWLLSYIKKLEFEFGNDFFKLCCQSYLTALKGLYIAKKTVIAYAY